MAKKASLRKVTVRVPATSANLGPGFDVLGIALSLHENYSFTLSESRSLSINGINAEELSLKRDNLVYRTADALGRKIGKRLNFDCIIKRQIPLGMGLGSSSAAIVATLVGLNKLCGLALSIDELFTIAVKIEGHPDNVAPALFGGLTVSYTSPDGIKCFVSKTAPSLRALVLVPCYSLATKTARSVLKPTVRREDAVYNMARAVVLTNLLMRNDVAKFRDEFRAAIDDRLHQPMRAKIVPGYVEAKRLMEKAGVLGAALSGAGPSLIGFTTTSELPVVTSDLKKLLKQQKLDYQVLELKVDLKGCEVFLRTISGGPGNGANSIKSARTVKTRRNTVSAGPSGKARK